MWAQQKQRPCRNPFSRHGRFSCGRSAFGFPRFFAPGKGPGFAVLGIQRPAGLFAQLVPGNESGHGVTSFRRAMEKENPRTLRFEGCGGRNRTQTCDPIDVPCPCGQIDQRSVETADRSCPATPAVEIGGIRFLLHQPRGGASNKSPNRPSSLQENKERIRFKQIRRLADLRGKRFEYPTG